ncbi:MAG: MBL fold metallo-hydrolase [Bacteriovoracaceae bacterium]|nr:MBL fold metallo-hydrolase [Bacteriovoracaceae bacterium]
MQIKTLFHKDTFTLTYIIHDEQTGDAIAIDPVLDYDPNGSVYSTEAIDEIESYINSNKLKLQLIMDTHAHADHISGADELKKRFKGSQFAIGESITRVQATFKELYNFQDLAIDGTQFDKLLSDGEEFSAGSLNIKAIHTPGHTPACYCFLIEDCLFTGDALFMPDFGTGRCDFPDGSATDLFNSIHDKLYQLPDETRVFVGHDYQPGGRELAYETSIGESKKLNKQLKEETTREDFVKFRTERDAVLKAPRLLLPSLQINIDGAKLPKSEDNGQMYLKIPIRPK